MAYTPTEWKDMDIITAEKLNKIEQGINQASNNVLVIESESGSGLNVTPNDINNAFENNSRIIIKFEGLGFIEASACRMEHESDGYYLVICLSSFSDSMEIDEFFAASATDYFVAGDNPSA